MIHNTTHLTGGYKKNPEKLSLGLKQCLRTIQLTNDLELSSAAVTLTCSADTHVNTWKPMPFYLSLDK